MKGKADLKQQKLSKVLSTVSTRPSLHKTTKYIGKEFEFFISSCSIYFGMLPCELATGIQTGTRIETQRPVGEKMRECRVLCLQGIGLVNLSRKYLLATEQERL